MPWSETSPMEERIRFVTLAQEGLFSHTEPCQGETLGFEETGDGIWSVYFCNYLLGRHHERDCRLHV